jgi:hypothetical protein
MVFFKPKFPIWVNLEGLAFEDVSIFYDHWLNFYGHLVYFIHIWYILWTFGIYTPVLVCYTMKNLATMHRRKRTFC